MTQFGEERKVAGIPRTVHGCGVSSEDEFVTRRRIPEGSYRLHADRRRHRQDEQASCKRAQDERSGREHPHQDRQEVG